MGTTRRSGGFPAMRIPEENRNMVLLAMVALCGFAVAAIVSLVEPSMAPTGAASADLTTPTSVRVVGPAFVPNTNPREHR
jgi:hypothetical protein